MGGYQQIETTKNNKMEMLVKKITKYLRGKYLLWTYHQNEQNRKKKLVNLKTDQQTYPN